MGLTITEGLIHTIAGKLLPSYGLSDSDFLKIGQQWEQTIGWGKSEKELAIRGHYNNSNYHNGSRYIIVRTPLDASLDQFRYGYYNAHGESYVYLEATKNFLRTQKGLVFKFICADEHILEKISTNEISIVEEPDSSYLRFDFKGSKTEELYSLLLEVFNLFNPIIRDWEKSQDEATNMITGDYSIYKKPSPVSQDLSLSFDPAVPICDIPYSSLNIPDYQRTYKWERKQINQLISDILEFQIEYDDNSEARYHIGTLVLHVNDNQSLDIVDGQQRMVSLALIFYYLLKNSETRSYAKEKYPDFFNSIAGFLERTEYDNSIAIQNLSRNFDAIKERSSDLNLNFFKTLMNKCQIAIVQLLDQAQAFQFFDSQNSRGRDLVPHDLLKAFHLREVTSADEKLPKYENVIRNWQGIKTSKLADFFLCLYRVKTWAKGNSAKYFTKDDVACFKGLSLKKFNGPKEKKEEQFPFYAATYFLSEFLNGNNYCRQLFIEKSNTFLENISPEYPFQIDGNVINGIGFFDFALYYYELFSRITKIETFKSGPLACSEAVEILELLSSYSGRGRTGDGYVREAFNALLLYYIDKFGSFQLGKAIEKIFVWCYHIRLSHSSVFLATVDKECRGESSMFKVLRDATTPFDFLNSYFELEQMYEDNGKELFAKFDDLGKIKRQ